MKRAPAAAAIAGVLLAVFNLQCSRSGSPVIAENESDPWVIRTDFSDDSSWAAVRRQIAEPQSAFGFLVNVQYVDDKKFSGLTVKDLVRSLPDDYPGFLCFIVDDITIKNAEHPILVVSLSPHSADEKDYERTPRQTPVADIKSFRALPSTIQSIENNLSIANMDFEEFANGIGDDGVFRGFSQ